MIEYENPWTFNNKVFLSEDIKGNYGFVYKITNLINQKVYIGRKYFWSKRKLRKKDKRRTTRESDWKKYYGSSSSLHEDIEKYGSQNFKREILSLHNTKGKVNYTEIKVQFQLDVLYNLDTNGEYLYYNTNIMGRYFTPRIINEKENMKNEK